MAFCTVEPFEYWTITTLLFKLYLPFEYHTIGTLIKDCLNLKTYTVRVAYSNFEHRFGHPLFILRPMVHFPFFFVTGRTLSSVCFTFLPRQKIQCIHCDVTIAWFCRGLSKKKHKHTTSMFNVFKICLKFFFMRSILMTTSIVGIYF